MASSLQSLLVGLCLFQMLLEMERKLFCQNFNEKSQKVAAGKFGIKIIPLNLLLTLKYTAKQFLNDFYLSCYIIVYSPCEKLGKHCAAHTLQR